MWISINMYIVVEMFYIIALIISGTYTLSVRDYDDLRGYLAKHYKIVTRRTPDHSCELYYITKSRTFTSLADLVRHYQGEWMQTLCLLRVEKLICVTKSLTEEYSCIAL